MLAVIAVAFLIATGAVYWASSNAHHGVYWADRICDQAQLLCNSPSWMLLARADPLCCFTSPDVEILTSPHPWSFFLQSCPFFSRALRPRQARLREL